MNCRVQRRVKKTALPKQTTHPDEMDRGASGLTRDCCVVGLRPAATHPAAADGRYWRANCRVL